MPRTHVSTGGGWESAIAAIAGGLTGASRTMNDIDDDQRRREAEAARQQDRQEALELRAAEAAVRQKAEERRAANEQTASAREDLEATRSQYGIGTDLPSSVSAIAQRAGRPDAVMGVMKPPAMTDLGASAATMSPVGPMALPSLASQFRPNAQERQTQQTNQTLSQIAQSLKTQNPATAQALQVGVASGHVPTLAPSAFAPPVDPAAADQAKRDKDFADFTRRTDYSNSHRPPKVTGGGGPPVTRKDDPKMPAGVKAYLGQLIEKYPDDRDAAEKELRSAMPSLIQAHPGLDLTTVGRQFAAAFPKPPSEGGAVAALLGGGPPVARTPAAGAPPAAPPPPSRADAAPSKPITLPNGQTLAPGKQMRLKSGQTVTFDGTNPDGSLRYH